MYFKNISQNKKEKKNDDDDMNCWMKRKEHIYIYTKDVLFIRDDDHVKGPHI